MIRTLIQQIVPDSSEPMVERVSEGVSTEVYRIRRQDGVWYLRVLPEIDASFAPEALVHALLQASQVRVPEVIYYEAHNPQLGRSLMLTTEIPGVAIGYGARPTNMPQILSDAGKALAQINSLRVGGFGWIRRDSAAPPGLVAEFPTYTAWMQHEMNESLHTLGQTQVLTQRDLHAIQVTIEQAEALFGTEPACLAHGDFDVTHIYHQAGKYTGIIDFGEIRGANYLYDLGHFQIESEDLLPYLLEGYADVSSLPPDYLLRIHIVSLLIAVRRLARRLARPSGTVYAPDLAMIKRRLHEVFV